MKEAKAINKLCKEYEMKIAKNKADMKMLLIDFAREYNEIWKIN